MINVLLLSYYQTIGQTKNVLLLSMIRSVIPPLFCGLLLLQSQSPTIFWLYYALAELITLGSIAIVILREKRKQPAPSFWLLNETKKTNILRYDFIMNPGDPELDLYFEMAELFFKKHLPASQKRIDALVESMRHLYEYAAAHNTPKHPSIYLRLEIIPEVRAGISVRWMGKSMNLSATRSDTAWIDLQDRADKAFADSIYGFNHAALHYLSQKKPVKPSTEIP